MPHSRCRRLHAHTESVSKRRETAIDSPSQSTACCSETIYEIASSQFPVYPPDLERIPEADLDCLPPYGKVVLVPDPPNPAGLQPLGLGHVALHVTRDLSPPLHGFYACSCAEVPFRNLPGYLIPGRRDEAAQLVYRSNRRPYE